MLSFYEIKSFTGALRTVLRGQFSNPTEVLSGVPQCSVLGPLLFILFVNVIPDVVKAQVEMYADDTKVYEKQTESRCLQQDLKNWKNGQGNGS